MAEAKGFEPLDPLGSHDFQSCRFGRSRTPPCGSLSHGAEMLAVGARFELAVGVNPQPLSRRSRYGHFGTPPVSNRKYKEAQPLWSSKKAFSKATERLSSTPVSISTW